ITLNGQPIEGWDPYARSEPETLRLAAQKLRLRHGGIRYTVEVRPYILPPEARFSSPSAHRRSAGPRLWNRQQGIYIYRGDRMIQSGGWCRLRTADEHTKLARISVDIPAGAEELFELNISKTQIRIPGAVRSDLAAIVSSVTRLAQEVYRTPPAPIVVSETGPARSDLRVMAINALVDSVWAAV